MTTFRARGAGWLLALGIAASPATAAAQAPQYHYVALDEVELPAGFLFFDPAAITNDGRVYGTLYSADFEGYIAVYRAGEITVLQPGYCTAANDGGTAGGYVIVDPETFATQAALFRGGATALVPPLPGETTSWVTSLNDAKTATVLSYDALGAPTARLFRQGQASPIQMPVPYFPQSLKINNQGSLSGTQGVSFFDQATGLRFDTHTGVVTLLEPQPTEPLAWGVDINNSGDVLGYSFIGDAVERIGVWDRKGRFQTYFVEGTPEIPTLSSVLRFNDRREIVITWVTSPPAEELNSYLVPEPGVRFNLADIVDFVPPLPGAFFYVLGINNHGDMVGVGIQGNAFLLERIGPR